MKFTSSIFLLCSAIILLQSCTDLKKGEQLSTITELSKTVDSIEVVLNENRIDSLKQLFDATRIIDQRINDTHASDTLTLEFALVLDEYKLMVQSIPEIEMNQLNIKKGIDELRVSISKLAKDISNASGEKNRYDEYIDFEKTKVNGLLKILHSFSEMRDKLTNDFTTVQNEVRNFANH